MKYAFKTYQMKVDDHVFWCVESEVLDGCVAQGDTLEEALLEFEVNENVWLETAKEFNIPIPDNVPIVPKNEPSGRISLRLAKSMHKEVAQLAEEDGVSINTFISNAISEKIGKTKTAICYIAPMSININDSAMNLWKEKGENDDVPEYIRAGLYQPHEC